MKDYLISYLRNLKFQGGGNFHNRINSSVEWM